MINGGLATLFVSDLAQAVDFYTRILGLELTLHVEGTWAQVDAGPGLIIGLHPAGDTHDTGVNGSTQIGLNVTESIDKVVTELTSRGVKFDGPIVNDDDAILLATFRDPDGNSLYLYEVKYAGAPAGE